MNVKTATTKNVEQDTIQRSVVVVVLGHVDHGKTSLLDYIRETKTADSESGGITQHIGAYQIQKDDEYITFIDTPGHEVFSSMREYGVKIADIAVLVVAADDGIKKQTQEAIQYIKKSKIPFVVAFNKMDKPEANIDKIKNQFLEEEVLLEGYGGDVPYVEVSAQTGQGVDDLLNMIVLLSEVSGVKEKEEKEPSVVVVESFQDSRKGVGATLIMRDGVASVGDFLVGGGSIVKLRAIEDYSGKRIETVTPGMPFVVYGFNKITRSGDVLHIRNSIKEAEDFLRNSSIKTSNMMKSAPKDKDVVSFIIKADTGGTMDAVMNTMSQMQGERYSNSHTILCSRRYIRF